VKSSKIDILGKSHNFFCFLIISLNCITLAKRDEQTRQLQNIVRDKLDLFIQCANGIDLFAEQQQPIKKGTEKSITIKQRIDKLDNLAAMCSDEAILSFKPLLDNTEEVRKVQSAIAVLQRIGPLLQIPNTMKQHIENGRYSAAIKAYRQSLVIEDDKIELLRQVKIKAAAAAQEARRQLESKITDSKLPVQTILDAIRDLGDLSELPLDGGGSVKHSPSLSCLLSQAAHFADIVEKTVLQTEHAIRRVYEGESIASITGEDDSGDEGPTFTDKSAETTDGNDKRGSNHWMDDIVETRVLATTHAVSVACTWLPRLLKIAIAARQLEKRRAALLALRKSSSTEPPSDSLTVFEVFLTNISPSISSLVGHATFCALGSNINDESVDLKKSFGSDFDVRLQNVIRFPPTPSQSVKCAVELATLFDVVDQVAVSCRGLYPTDNESGQGGRLSLVLSPVLEDCVALTGNALIAIERRRCKHVFEVCARNCVIRASGSGIVDADALLSCLQKLSEELTRPEQSCLEIKNGCEDVIGVCCDSLSDFVEARGDSAILQAVSACAVMLSGRIGDIVREVSTLTNDPCITLEKSLLQSVSERENELFDVFLGSIRQK